MRMSTKRDPLILLFPDLPSQVPDSSLSWFDGERNPAFFPRVPGVGRQASLRCDHFFP